MLVVDASVLVPLLVAEPSSAIVRAVVAAESELLAPDLILAETLNVLWKKQLLGRIDASLRVEAVGLVGPPLLPLVAMPPLARRTSALAHELDHPVYDCFYLALAEREGAPPVTADARLVAKVAPTRYSGLVRPLGGAAP